MKQELIDKINELAPTHTNGGILKKLKELGYRIGIESVRHNTDPNRNLTLVCKKCGEKFTRVGFRKWCDNCRNKSKIINKNDTDQTEFRIEMKKMMDETKSISGLNEGKINDLLQNNTHTEIRNCFVDGVQVKKLPTYEFVVKRKLD